MDKFKAWLQTKNGKTVAIIAVFLIGIVVYLKVRKTSPAQPVPGLSVSPQGTSDGSITPGASGSVPPPVESPSQQLQDWYSQIEGKAIGSDPGNAALIDATLGDMQNGAQLTPSEASEWQKILSAFGAPPMPVGSQLNLLSNVASSKTPVGANASTVSGSNFVQVGTQSAGTETPGSAVFLQNSDGSYTHVSPGQLAAQGGSTPIYAELGQAGTAGNQHLTPGSAVYIQEPNGSYYHVSPGQLQDIISKNPNQAIYTEQK